MQSSWSTTGKCSTIMPRHASGIGRFVDVCHNDVNEDGAPTRRRGKGTCAVVLVEIQATPQPIPKRAGHNDTTRTRAVPYLHTPRSVLMHSLRTTDALFYLDHFALRFLLNCCGESRTLFYTLLTPGEYEAAQFKQ
eukprot:scaffold27909_cov36-Prasinocladus_malaysianus.AAC.1